MTDTQTAVLCECGKEQKTKSGKSGPKCPKGWKHYPEGTYTCGACWGKKYHMAAVTFPIAHCDWDAVRPAFAECSAAVRELSNWAIRKLFANDAVRSADDVKIPAMPPIYLYGLAPECPAWSHLRGKVGADVLSAVERCYRSERYETVWTGERSLRSYRYPQGVPIDGEGVRVRIDERIVVNVLIGQHGRHDLTLAGGPQMKRQRGMLEHLAETPDLLTQAVLMEDRSTVGDHRPTNESRENSGGVRIQKRLKIKLVGWFPVRERGESTNTLSVRSDADSLLVALDHDGERIWTYNGDHAKRIADRHAAHLRNLDRLADDRKSEKRRPKREGRGFVAMLGDKSHTDRSRLKSLCHEASASVVNFAVRRRCSTIRLDLSDRQFAFSFPWSMLETMISQKCRSNGIELVQ